MNGTVVRRTFWVASVAVLVLGVAVTATAQQEHVTMCHATGSASNPYVLISPSVSGAFHGHLQHTGPIFDPDVHGNGGGWGDIIPTFLYQGETYSLNWPAGEATLAAGCRLPAEEEQPPQITPGPPVTPPEAPPEVHPRPPVEAQPPFTG